VSLNDGLSNRILFLGGCSASSGVKHATYQVKVKSRNMGTLTNCSATEPSSPQRLETVGHGDGICVVVRARESRAHGEGG
jgi:hypothetical protein